MSIDRNTKVMTQEMTGNSCGWRVRASAGTWVAHGSSVAWLAKLALAAALIQSTPGMAQQPAFATAPVTAEMTLAAMGICVVQLHAGAFDADALTGAGWVRAISADGDPVIRGYRHPDNMILLNTMDSTSGPDKCAVMAPTGLGLTLESMRAAVEAQDGVRTRRNGDTTSWTAENLSFVLKSMGSAGVVIEIQAGNR